MSAFDCPPGRQSSSASKVSTWELDPVHPVANFSIKHLMISKVHGSFHKLNATLKLDRGTPANSSVEARVDVASIDTHDVSITLDLQFVKKS